MWRVFFEIQLPEWNQFCPVYVHHPSLKTRSDILSRKWHRCAAFSFQLVRAQQL